MCEYKITNKIDPCLSLQFYILILKRQALHFQDAVLGGIGRWVAKVGILIV